MGASHVPGFAMAVPFRAGARARARNRVLGTHPRPIVVSGEERPAAAYSPGTTVVSNSSAANGT
jgi:hypothetical protein